MKQFFDLAVFLIPFFGFSQSEINYQKPPVFKECAATPFEDLRECFRFQLHTFIFENFEILEEVKEDNYKGEVKLLFEVDKDESFKLYF